MELRRQKAAPAVVLAFDCAGRKGRLKNLADEWQAMRQSLGTQLPLFGTYNAGEVGPADLSERQPQVRCSSVGWHVMFTAIGF